MSQSLVLFGQATGAVVFTSMSDRFGRKPIHVVCHLLLLAVGVATAFMPTFTPFTVLRFFIGMLQQVYLSNLWYMTKDIPNNMIIL